MEPQILSTQVLWPDPIHPDCGGFLHSVLPHELQLHQDSQEPEISLVTDHNLLEIIQSAASW